MNRQEVGRLGEAIAADLLQSKGFEVLDRNWRCADGELDIVVRSADTVAAVEVKTRRSVSFGSPEESVGRAKAARLRRLLAAWLAENPQQIDEIRIDVVAILLRAPGPALVRHLVAVA